MKTGQLELTLDYPGCMAGAESCERIHCPYNLGAKAAVRCAMAVATVTGGLEVAEIAKLIGVHKNYVGQTLRSAMRKLGPQLALVVGKEYDPDKRICWICGDTFAPRLAGGTDKSCSDGCRAQGRKTAWRGYNHRKYGSAA